MKKMRSRLLRTSQRGTRTLLESTSQRAGAPHCAAVLTGTASSPLRGRARTRRSMAAPPPLETGDSCPSMTKEQRYAAGLRMIHPKEGDLRRLVGVGLLGAGMLRSPYSTVPTSLASAVELLWKPQADLLIAAGIMLWNMGRLSQ